MAVKEDMLFRFIVNAAAFAEGAQVAINNLSRMDKKVSRLGKTFDWVNVAIGNFVADLASDAFRAGVRGFGKLIAAIGEAEGVAERIENLKNIVLEGLGGPLWSSITSIVQDALGRLTSAFRDSSGRWTEGFLRLRATVQVFANWLLSLWERLMGSLEGVGQNWLDRLVDAIARAVQKAAALLRRFAQFVARIFGGTAPAAVTGAAVAGTQPTEGWEPTAAYIPPTPAPAAKPKAKAKAIKPVSPPDPGLIAEYNALLQKAAAWMQKLAQAQAAVARAQAAFNKAQEAWEKASEKVYNIRRKIAKLETQWAEIPERFVRGRKRQLQLELQAAEHEEHQRQREMKAARERLQAALEYERQIERTANALARQAEQMAAQIERQQAAYEAYLERLAEAAAAEGEVGQAAVDQFAELDGLTAGFIEEIEGQLLPAFADIELSVASIADSLGVAWEKGKVWANEVRISFEKLLTETGPRLLQLFSDVADKILEIWNLLKEAYQTVQGWIPEDRESQVERWRGVTEGMRDSKPEVEQAAEESFFEPVLNVFNSLFDALVGGSVVPEMVESILEWFDKLELDLTPILDSLIGRLQIVEKAFKGLIPTMEEFGFASGGSFKVTIVNLQNSTFGEGLTETIIKGWIYDAIGNVVV